MRVNVRHINISAVKINHNFTIIKYNNTQIYISPTACFGHFRPSSLRYSTTNNNNDKLHNRREIEIVRIQMLKNLKKKAWRSTVCITIVVTGFQTNGYRRKSHSFSGICPCGCS